MRRQSVPGPFLKELGYKASIACTAVKVAQNAQAYTYLRREQKYMNTE